MSELNAASRQQIEKYLGVQILSSEALGGGSINEARLLETARGSYFVKYNTEQQAAATIQCEVAGLELLAQQAILSTPQIHLHGQAADQYFLLLEYIPTGQANRSTWEDFGRGLAQLHRQSAPQFGHHPDNFIGSLPQSNRSQSTWSDFYWLERIQPQLRMACDQGWIEKEELSYFEEFKKEIPALFPEEAPALIHGDLWSGNFVIGSDQQAVLIDPSVAYAHREMDWAMSRLFGGFAPRFYSAYQEEWALAPGIEERLEYYQLYYLLVHLNLFGWSYRQAVLRIIRPFGSK